MINITAPPFPVTSYLTSLSAGGPQAKLNASGGSGLEQPLPPPLPTPISVEDEPPNKKQRSEDNLIPEAEFIAMHKVNRCVTKLVKNYILNQY